MSGDTDSPNEPEMGVTRAVDILEGDSEARHEENISDEEVADALRTVISKGTASDKRLGDVTLPSLAFDYEVLEGTNTYPLDLTGATIESLSLENADLRLPILLDGAEIGALELDYARFGYDLTADHATIETISCYETEFDGNAEFDGATITGPVTFREADFEDDVSFDGVAFEDEVRFDAADLYGESNRLEDNTSFREVRFGAEASFRQTNAEFTSFEGATFEDRAVFIEAVFDGDVNFAETTFESDAVFDESRFVEDTIFAESTFENGATFDGAEFRGGARAIEDDLSFEGARFNGEMSFRLATFRGSNFSNATFEGRAIFESGSFSGDVDFIDARFESLADFDEVRFQANADFTGVTFETECDFRGAEFHGGDNHLSVAATFSGVSFGGDADFDNTLFTTAVFEDVLFTGLADFRGAVFEEEFVFDANQRTNETYVNCTGATLKEGRISQPEGGWVRYDLTKASIGDIQLEAESVSDHKELLDYFRFCETEFNEFDSYNFDFSDHTDYLDRNNWVLHTFDSSWADYEPSVELTPESIERTYLKAKIAASAAGNQQAAGEFRVKRQQFARSKYWDIVSDGSESPGTRLLNGARALENLFLGVTCGHGLRLTRIITVFVLFPVLPTLLYTFGGPAFATSGGPITDRTLSSFGAVLTPEGAQVLFENGAFSYITFLTIGYGNVGPAGWAAKVLAASEVYIGVILGGLLLYALIKRSEV